MPKYKISAPYFDKDTQLHPAGSIVELDEKDVLGQDGKPPSGWVKVEDEVKAVAAKVEAAVESVVDKVGSVFGKRK